MTSKRHSPGESVVRWSRFHLCSLNSLGCSLAEKSLWWWWWWWWWWTNRTKCRFGTKRLFDNDKCCGLAKVLIEVPMLLYTPVYLQLWLLGRRKGILELSCQVFQNWIRDTSHTHCYTYISHPLMMSNDVYIGMQLLCSKASVYSKVLSEGASNYATHEFAVFPEAKLRKKTANDRGLLGAYTTLFHGVTDLYYTMQALILR